ncbi:MAG: M20/M25/M40 family metallo-hydrolase [Planctomycetales bacterium]|nr:M20/M25/M40 family metallo-hydrolase [Planctomycetales bacterium]
MSGFRAWRFACVGVVLVLSSFCDVGLGRVAGLRAAELAARLTARNRLTSDELHRHAAVLADDTFEGREAGKRGGRAAAGYLVDKLKSYGLNGAGSDGGYLQPFDRERQNVLAQLPGTDPELRKEVIVIGAHYDHVGYGNQRNSYGPYGYIHNGADDNASGVAAVLETARVLTELKVELKRTVVFAFWDGEEAGLYGSKHWLSRPTANLPDVRCFINLDMIGRLRDDVVEVFGSRTAHGLRKLLTEANRSERLVLDYKWELRDDSDHAPFFHAGIPVVMLHTGKHNDYHRPSDDVEKLNVDGILRISRLAMETVFQLADAPTVPKFRALSKQEAVSEAGRKGMDRPYAAPPGRLGLSWRDGDDGSAGILVSNVQYGSPAAKAGLRIGERITHFDGTKIADDELFQKLVVRAPANVTLKVVDRAGAERDAAVELRGEPVIVGVSWAEDDAEPQMVVVKRIVPGSPAATAGVQVADRIYEVDGTPLADAEDFDRRLETMEDKISFTVDRAGITLHFDLRLDQ